MYITFSLFFSKDKFRLFYFILFIKSFDRRPTSAELIFRRALEREKALGAALEGRLSNLDSELAGRRDNVRRLEREIEGADIGEPTADGNKRIRELTEENNRLREQDQSLANEGVRIDEQTEVIEERLPLKERIKRI